MNKRKLIKFLLFIGIEDTKLSEQINNASFDLTSVILSMTATKTNESVETITNWYNKFT